MSNIYLAGGYIYDLQEVFSRVKGVDTVEAGYINCSDSKASAKEIAAGETDAALAIKVSYNPKKTDLGTILQIFFKLINPYAEPTHPKYRTGVYYEHGEDLFQIEYYFRFLRMRGTEPVTTDSNIVINDSVTHNLDTRTLLTELQRLQRFVVAPEEEQFYLRKHPEAPKVLDLEAIIADGLIE